MGTRPYATTNRRADEVCRLLDEMIDWAEADAEHADENDAPEVAKDDRWRAKQLRAALALIKLCYR